MVSNYWEGFREEDTSAPSTNQQPRRWKNRCVIGGKYFFNPSMQYIMALIEALGYITSGTSGLRGWSFNKGPQIGKPIGCLICNTGMDTRMHDIIDLLGLTTISATWLYVSSIDSIDHSNISLVFPISIWPHGLHKLRCKVKYRHQISDRLPIFLGLSRALWCCSSGGEGHSNRLCECLLGRSGRLFFAIL